VTAGIALGAFAVVLAARKRLGRLVWLTMVTSTVAAAGLVWALSVGGESVSQRLSTLVDDDPGSVYHNNRGHFLQETVEVLLPEYPLGAGLGRWGMMSAYFGDHSNALWAEIQWTGWLLDGGIPLVVVYVLAILSALVAVWRMTRARSGVP